MGRSPNYPPVISYNNSAYMANDNKYSAGAYGALLGAQTAQQKEVSFPDVDITAPRNEKRFELPKMHQLSIKTQSQVLGYDVRKYSPNYEKKPSKWLDRLFGNDEVKFQYVGTPNEESWIEKYWWILVIFAFLLMNNKNK